MAGAGGARLFCFVHPAAEPDFLNGEGADLFLGHVESVAAGAAVAGNAVSHLHERVQDTAGQGRHNVPFEAARATQFPGFDVHLRAYFQSGSLADGAVARRWLKGVGSEVSLSMAA